MIARRRQRAWVGGAAVVAFLASAVFIYAFTTNDTAGLVMVLSLAGFGLIVAFPRRAR